MSLHKTLISSLFLILVVIVLLLQSQLTFYSAHLSTDIYVYYNRANHFITNTSLKNLENNEYQPGATLFFITLSPTLLTSSPLDSFKLALFIFNIFFIAILAYIYRQIAHINILIFALLILFTGPIIFFRFDLLVALLVVLSITFWNKNHYLLSACILALATMVKVYPIIFIPYLLITAFKNFGIKLPIKFLSVFTGTIILFLFSYIILFQVSPQDILSGLKFHALKPVSTDNLYGILIYLYETATSNMPPQMISAYGTNGLAYQDIFFPLEFYNYFWVIPFILIHLTLLRKKAHDGKIDIVFYLLNIITFFVFAKSVAPQYMIWFISLIPLLPPSVYLKNSWIVLIILTLASLFFYQYIYPLNYNLWLDGFRPPYEFGLLMPINVFRNIFLFGIILLLIYETLTLRNQQVSQDQR